jgi:hypothetical protein
MFAIPAEASAKQRFGTLGYLVLPGLLDASLTDRLRPEVDRWVDDGLRARSIACCAGPVAGALPEVLELELTAHGELITWPALMSVLTSLLGTSFVFHHLHSDRQLADAPGKSWHHDYEPNTSGDRGLPMVHALHYIEGLEPEESSLVVLPGSHREAGSAKHARAQLGTAEVPGELIIDDLPPGSTVLVHSALFHARRPPLAVGRGRPRYLVDASYCQIREGVRWRPVKPYWRHALSRARELGLDGGRWPELFADRHFTEYTLNGQE